MRLVITSAFLAILALLPIYGCTIDGERGFKSSEPQFMEELESALTRQNIPFRKDFDGFIRYQSKYEESVKRIRQEVERDLDGGIAVKYDDKASRDYLRILLSSQSMKFRVETRNDGEWIRWYPESETQRKEIEMKVVQHHFDIESQKTPSGCNGGNLPSNNSLNTDAAQKARRAC